MKFSAYVSSTLSGCVEKFVEVYKNRILPWQEEHNEKRDTVSRKENEMKQLMWIVSLVVLGGFSSNLQAAFVDNFDRADGAVGNGWIITASGNGGGGGGTVPSAVIAGNKVQFDRNGWGPDATVTMFQPLMAPSLSASVDVLVPSITGTSGSSGFVQVKFANTLTGGFVVTRFTNIYTDGSFRMQVADMESAGWDDWSYYYPSATSGPNPGELSLSFIYDPSDSSYTVSALKNDLSVYGSYTSTNVGLGAGFDQIFIDGGYTGWTGASSMYIDNVETVAIPEPSVALLTGFGFIVSLLFRRK